MPTLEERIAALERAQAVMRSEQFTSINARFDAQAAGIRMQFGETNMAITSLTVTVQSQGHDIRAIKERLDRMDKRFDGVDSRLGGIDTHLASQDEKLTQILERLPRQGES